jgi:hypothetical protein
MSGPGHFGKRLYDSCYFPEIVRQETAPGNYRLYDGEWNNSSKCGSLIGPRQNRNARIGSTGEFNAGSIAQRAEVESLLTDRGWDTTKCTPGNLLKVKNAALKKAHEDFKLEDRLCNKYLDFEYSRLDLDVKDFTYQDYNRWIDLQINPNEWVFYGNKVKNDKDRFGVQTRYETKKILDSFNSKIRVNQ